MFSHIMVGANDIEKSKLFYDKVLGVLGADEGRLFPNLTGQKRYFYFLDGMTFCISEPINNRPATSANGSTIGFNIIDESMGDEWHKAGIENGGESIEDMMSPKMCSLLFNGFEVLTHDRMSIFSFIVWIAWRCAGKAAIGVSRLAARRSVGAMASSSNQWIFLAPSRPRSWIVTIRPAMISF